MLIETQPMTKRMSIKTMRRKLGNLQHKLGNSPCHIPVRSIVKDNTAEKIEAAVPLMDLSEYLPFLHKGQQAIYIARQILA